MNKSLEIYTTKEPPSASSYEEILLRKHHTIFNINRKLTLMASLLLVNFDSITYTGIPHCQTHYLQTKLAELSQQLASNTNFLFNIIKFTIDFCNTSAHKLSKYISDHNFSKPLRTR